MDFWAQHHSHLPAGATAEDTQLNVLAREMQSSSGLMQGILREMFASARRSGVDTYFYMPAISPEVYSTPDGYRYITELQAKLSAFAVGETNGHVRFDPNGLQGRVPTTAYKDIVHKLDPRPEADVLAGDLCYFLEQRGHRAGCEQP